MSDIFQVPGYITKVTSMQRWWRITVDTQENIPPESMSNVIKWMNDQMGYFTFSLAPIRKEDVEDLPEITLRPEDKKTPAQRLHTALWRLWKAKPEGFEDSESHYRSKMEKFIEHVEKQIP